MKKTYSIIFYILLLFLVAAAAMRTGYHSALRQMPEPVVRTDTVRIAEPVLDTIKEVRYVTRWLPVDREMQHDTVCVADTMPVVIPIETKVYFEEDRYYAEVKGFEAELTYIETYDHTNIEYIDVPVVPRFTFGPTVAAGAGPQGTGWMIGIGATYNIVPRHWYTKRKWK